MFKKIIDFILRYNPITLYFGFQMRLNNKIYQWAYKNKKQIKKALGNSIIYFSLLFDLVSVLFLIMYVINLLHITTDRTFLLINGFVILHILIILLSTAWDRYKFIKGFDK